MSTISLSFFSSVVLIIVCFLSSGKVLFSSIVDFHAMLIIYFFTSNVSSKVSTNVVFASLLTNMEIEEDRDVV
jgi:hypothetical protein